MPKVAPRVTQSRNSGAFDFNGHQLRTIEIEGAPWFLGGDILTILFGTACGKGQIYRQIADDEQTKVSRTDLGLRAGKPLVAVNESGFYKLVMRSDKPVAREFQNWVTRDVLPSIRKTGGYLLNADARRTAHDKRNPNVRFQRPAASRHQDRR